MDKKSFNLRDRFWEIDAILVDKPKDQCPHYDPAKYVTVHEADPLKWLLSREVWYLADGGYSRIAWDDWRHKLFLTSNSLPSVKARWPLVADLIADLERDLLTLIESEGRL